MRHEASLRSALRYMGDRRTTRRVLRGAGIGILFALSAALQACSTDPSWPTLGKMSDLTNVLTAEERQKAVQDLQKNDPNREKDAAAAKAAPAQ
jgi:hypothetical protein